MSEVRIAVRMDLFREKNRIETNPGKNPGLRAKTALDATVGGKGEAVVRYGGDENMAIGTVG
jgi:hypothetical protein